MKHMRSWLGGVSLQKKLILYSYLIITPILLLISILMFQANYRSSVEQSEQLAGTSLQGLNDNLRTIQTDMQNLCTYVCINDDINEVLNSRDVEGLNAEPQLWLNRAPMRIVQDMMALKGYIKTIAVYPENGVKPYLRCMDASSYISTLSEAQETQMYREAIAAHGKVLWANIGKDDTEVFQTNRSDKIVLYRELYNRSKQKKLGYIVLGASSDRFEAACDNALQQEDESILVFSKEGNRLISGGTEQEEVTDYLSDYSFLMKCKEHPKTQYEYKNYRIFSYVDSESGLMLFKIFPKDSLVNQIFKVAATPLALLGGVLLGLLPILLIVSNMVTKPLKKVCVAMNAFQKGDFSQQVETRTTDEVGQVAATFNQMVESIRLLIDNNYVMALKERESELALLQAQINPHFLYNTLDALYWQAQEAGNEEIAEDILALSQLFRLVLGQGKAVLTVREEAELISRYLHIQKMRFSKRLDYDIQMDPEILENEMPKLILQPFVENAIVHGLENADRLCELHVSGHKDGNYMDFTIRDTGVGMTEEQIQGIWNMEESKRYSSQRIGRYAIKNVRERLELKYHKDFKLEITSTPGKGTTVRIRIPADIKGV
ncbi:MAG: sensor histidine kinase [Lachnospiraceae bacterium]|nr:sensor histidine kinase [Lachnospiraceae bacterium]